MATVVIVAHKGRAQANALAAQARAWLEERGHVVHDEGLVEHADLALSLGGDGTMLRTVDLVCAAGVPVLGVNVGHLGYLTEVDPAGLEAALQGFFDGTHRIEERMTLQVEIEGHGPPALALNEVVVEKTRSGHTVRLAVHLGGTYFTTFACDALIVATPTGSTAYNLSARGPILSPRLDAVLLTPVSPHMLFDRSLVLDPDEPVRLEVDGGPPAAVVADGQQIWVLEPGQAVTTSRGPHPARLVTFGEREFHRILKTKFGLADR